MDNPYVRLTREFNRGRLRALLARYREASLAWAAAWPGVQRETDGLALAEAHVVICRRALGVLPFAPPEPTP